MTFGVRAPEFPGSGCAVVFGGSGGIGGATAGLLAERGCDVALTYRSREEKAAEVVASIESLGRRAAALRCDVVDPDQVRSVIDAAVAEFGGIHTVVSAAGLVFRTAPMVDFDGAEFGAVIDTDVRGFFNIAKATVPWLRARGGGSITALITTAVARAAPTDALSTTPKAAVAMMVRQLATEEAGRNVRANAVGPGVVEGGMVVPMRADPPTSALLDQAVALTPLGRAAEEAEVAEAVTFLASTRASYITGQLLMVDGGLAA